MRAPANTNVGKKLTHAHLRTRRYTQSAVVRTCARTYAHTLATHKGGTIFHRKVSIYFLKKANKNDNSVPTRVAFSFSDSQCISRDNIVYPAFSCNNFTRYHTNRHTHACVNAHWTHIHTCARKPWHNFKKGLQNRLQYYTCRSAGAYKQTEYRMNVDSVLN